MMDQYARFNQEARDAGVFVSGEALQPSITATVIRMMESGLEMSDGTFIDASEVLAGFYMLECDNLDQAIEWSAKIPAARHGAIEVRPVADMGS